MALVKYGGGVVDMRGSIAGTVFSKNRSGQYARARTKPVNPNTELQDNIRSAMAFVTNQWAQALTAVQRTGWNLYASNVAMKNRLGEAIYLSGFNHYIRSNVPRKQMGVALIAAGPIIFELPAQDPLLLVTGSKATQILTIAYDDTMDWDNETGGFIFFYQGQPQNPQRNFFGGPWRLISGVAGATGAPVASPFAAAVAFAIAELQRQWIYARILRADGRISEPFRADCFVAA